MICVDTNILVYVHRRRSPEHRAAIRAMNRLRLGRRGWGVAWPTLAEFWRTVTNPDHAAPSTPEQARDFLAELLGDDGHLWLPGPDDAPALWRQAATRGLRGRRIHDLQIALIARAAGADEIWTHDAGFVRVAGLRVVDPLEAAR